MCPDPRFILRLAGFALFLGVVAGCGIKGPLYLPKPPAAAKSADVSKTVPVDPSPAPALPSPDASQPE